MFKRYKEIDESDARTLMEIMSRCGINNLYDFVTTARNKRDVICTSPNLENPSDAEILRAGIGSQLAKPARLNYIGHDIAEKCGILEALPTVAQYCYGGVYVHSADEAEDLSDIFDEYEVY